MDFMNSLDKLKFQKIFYFRHACEKFTPSKMPLNMKITLNYVFSNTYEIFGKSENSKNFAFFGTRMKISPPQKCLKNAK